MLEHKFNQLLLSEQRDVLYGLRTCTPEHQSSSKLACVVGPGELAELVWSVLNDNYYEIL